MKCLVCLEPLSESIEIFGDIGEELGIAKILAKYFWFTPVDYNGVSTVICQTCWSRVHEFHEFYMQVEQAHILLGNESSIAVEDSDVKVFPEPENIIMLPEPNLELKLPSETCDDPLIMLPDDCDEPLLIPLDIGKTQEKDLFEDRTEVLRLNTTPSPVETVKPSHEEPATLSTAIHVKSPVYKEKRKRVDSMNGLINNEDGTPKQEAILNQSTSLAELNGKTPFKCTYCDQIFTFKKHMENHIRYKHLKDNPHRCTYCSRTFTRKEYMENHIRHKHSKDNPHRCSYCLQTFARKEQMTNHILQKHSKENPHRCTYCLKTFTRKDHMENHIRQHTGDTPFKCTYCTKTFYRKDHMENHIRKHTGDTRLKCTYCTKTFTRKDYMENHIQKHFTKGETTYHCDVCSKTYTREDSLILHKRLHTGDSLHKCEYCEKSFTRKEYIKSHMRSRNCKPPGDNRYCCNTCNKTFACKATLTNHMSKFHPNATKNDGKIVILDEKQIPSKTNTFKEPIKVKETPLDSQNEES